MGRYLLIATITVAVAIPVRAQQRWNVFCAADLREALSLMKDGDSICVFSRFNTGSVIASRGEKMRLLGNVRADDGAQGHPAHDRGGRRSAADGAQVDHQPDGRSDRGGTRPERSRCPRRSRGVIL